MIFLSHAVRAFRSVRRRAIALLTLTLVVSTLVLAPAPVGATQPTTVTSMTLTSEAGDQVVGSVFSQSLSWLGGEELTLQAQPYRGQLAASVHAQARDADGTTAGDDFDFTFAAPDGEPLTPGTYEVPRGVRRDGSPDGLPIISASGGSRGCGSSIGSFTVHEIDLEAGRLWLSFVYYCGDVQPAAYGEIRIDVEAQTADGLLAPGVADWPEHDVGETSPAPGLLLRNTGAAPVSVDSVQVDGANATDFAATEECEVVQPGAVCPVAVAFDPRGVGARTATLRVGVTGPSGPDELVTTLRGSGIGGFTRAVVRGEPGDWNFDGRTVVVTAEAGPFGYYDPDEGRAYVSFQRSGPDFTFAGPDDEPLHVGYYPNARRWPFNGDAPGISVNSCNTIAGEFYVHEIVVDALDQLRSFSASFVQRCNGSEAAVRGSISFRSAGPPPARGFPALDVGQDRGVYDRGDDARVSVSGHLVPAGTTVELVGTPVRRGAASRVLARGPVSPGEPLVATLRRLGSSMDLAARVVDENYPVRSRQRLLVRPERRATALRTSRRGAVAVFGRREPARYRLATDRSSYAAVRPTVQQRRGGTWRPVRGVQRVELRRGLVTWVFDRRDLRGRELRVRFVTVARTGEAAAISDWERFRTR